MTGQPSRAFAAWGVALAAGSMLAAGSFALGGPVAATDAEPTVSATAEAAASGSASESGLPSETASPTATEGLASEPPAGTERYIVVGEGGTSSEVATAVEDAGGAVVATYDKAVIGAVADLTGLQAAELAQADGIDYLERDQPVSVSGAVITDPGCATTTLPRGDDVSSPAVALGFTVNWFGTSYSRVHVNSNGGIALDDGNGSYTDYAPTIADSERPIVLPLGTDIDTTRTTAGSASSQVTYGTLTYGTRPAFCVNYVGIGAYPATAPAYSAQLLIVDRSDVRAGEVDLIFNYDRIDTLVSSRAIEIGYANPDDRTKSLRVSGSGTSPTSFGDGKSLARISSRQDGTGYTSEAGRYVYPIRNAAGPTATATPSASPTTTATSPCSTSAPTTSPAGTQACAPWGLDRIDQRNLPLDTLFSPAGTGSGVKAYVVDTGIRTTHAQFATRIANGYDFVEGDTTPQDCNGHGTHVAGIVAGTTYGVAKSVTVVPIRVLDCYGDGWTSDVIAGIDWAIADHAASEPAVMNMSLGGSYSKTLNDATARAVTDGITVVVAAGNESADACGVSPASTATAITVAATGTNDARASYSNYGNCVDLFAPGSSITSAGISSDTSAATYSGTSMASPHVAGAAAVALSLSPSATPADIAATLEASATSGVVTSASSTKSGLLQVRTLTTATASAAPQAPAPAAPAAPAGGSSGGGSSGGDSGGGGGGALQTITEVRPASGPLAGGNSVAIIGYGFTGASAVTIGGKAAEYRVVNDAFVDVVMPPGDRLGSADIAVVLSPTRGRAFAPGGYVYVADAPAPSPTVPVAPTEPDRVGILREQLPAVVTPLRKPTVRVVGGRTSINFVLPPSAAGLRAVLLKGKRQVASGTVANDGAVTLRGGKVASGSYRIALREGATTIRTTAPIRLTIPRR